MRGLVSEDESQETVLKNISSCFVTKGYSRSVIIDTQRADYRIVPNSLIGFMDTMQFKSKREIYGTTSNEDESSTVTEYLDYLEEMEFSFWCPKIIENNFPDVSLEWDSHSVIQNAIISINRTTDILTIISQLERFNCFHIQLRLYDYLRVEDLDILLKHFEFSIFTSIELHLGYFNTAINDIAEILAKHPRVHVILFLNSAEEAIYSVNEYQRIVFSSIDADKSDSVSNISIEQFIANITFYNESLLHNVYFNRKLCLDKDGYIRNSLELPWHYGNISDTQMEDAVKSREAESHFFKKYARADIDFGKIKPAFNSLWDIHKQMIDVCKDCEFRNMCLDARCPLQRENGTWYHNTECNYNPYISKWHGEDGYKTLSECSVIANETTYYRDDKVLEEINKILWQE
ncbi:MAG: hypothetical protein ACO1G5_00895 [Bacteroidota bacterium]